MVILVVVAHPDDEVLGCGGALARWVKEGHEVHVAILAEGATSRDHYRDRGAHVQELGTLNQAAQEAGRIMGVASVALKGLPDNRLDSVDRLEVTKMVEGLVDSLMPDTVVTHHAGDLNNDHRRVHEAVVTACRPQPRQCVRRLLFFEVASSTEWQTPGSGAVPFEPNVFVDIGETLDRKMAALQAYEAEMRLWPHSRSMEAVGYLARWRGASVGVPAAEAFVLGRDVS